MHCQKGGNTLEILAFSKKRLLKRHLIIPKCTHNLKYQPKHLTPDQGQSQPGLSSAGCKQQFLPLVLKPTLCENQCRKGEHRQVMSQSHKIPGACSRSKETSGFLHVVLESNCVNENVKILATKTVHSRRENSGWSKEQIITVTSNPVLEDATALLCPALTHR